MQYEKNIKKQYIRDKIFKKIKKKQRQCKYNFKKHNYKQKQNRMLKNQQNILTYRKNL